MTEQLHGDNLDLLSTLALRSVQAIITSPPYFGLREYQIPPSAWPEVTYCPLIGLPPVTIPTMVCQLGAEPDPLAYIGHLVHVFRLARPALRDDGTLWVNLGDSYARTGGTDVQVSATAQVGSTRRTLDQTPDRRQAAPDGIPDKNLLGIPQRAALALQADGWVWRSEVIWHAPNKMPESVRDRFTRAHEQVLLFGKGPRYYFDSEAVAEPATMRIQRRLTPQETRPNGHAVDGWKEPRILRAEPSADGDGTRNKRDVWTIATTPMPANLRGDGAHYAAWPPALVESMIKASTANKACGACGAAWARQVERESTWAERKASGATAGNVGVSESYQNGVHGKGVSHDLQPKAVRDLGFAPACRCESSVGRCVVLDPFGGTGTTGAVAEQLGRDSILIDLGYQELQEKRTNNLQIAMEAYL